jgi:hypothetical protein
MEKQRFVLLDKQLGPWAGYLNAYTKLIKERGYSPVSVQTQVQLIRRFSQWLRRRHAAIGALDEIVVERFPRRLQVLHAVATPPRCTGTCMCYATREPPGIRRNRFCFPGKD